eukprot:6219755-Pyramimonas_sp.AAC.1
MQNQHLQQQQLEEQRAEWIRQQTAEAFKNITPEQHQQQLQQWYKEQEEQAMKEDAEDLAQFAQEFQQNEMMQQQIGIMEAIQRSNTQVGMATTVGGTATPVSGGFEHSAPQSSPPPYPEESEVDQAIRMADDELDNARMIHGQGPNRITQRITAKDEMEVKMQEEEIKAVVESHEAVEVESSIAPTSPVPTEVPTEQATPRYPEEDPYMTAKGWSPEVMQYKGGHQYYGKGASKECGGKAMQPFGRRQKGYGEQVDYPTPTSIAT